MNFERILFDMIDNAVPILFCVLGGNFAYKVNVLNISMEGMLLMGAFSFPEAFLREIVCYSKGIFANFSEKRFIEQELGLLDLTELFGMGSTEVIVITLGKDGSLCYEKTAGSYKVTEIPVAKGAAVVDTVGSGDAYIAGFLYGYLNGCVPVECCRMGSVMASFILEKRGCLSSVPEKEEFIKHYEAYRQNTEGDKSR